MLQEIVKFTKRCPLALLITRSYQLLSDTIYSIIAAADSVTELIQFTKVFREVVQLKFRP